MNRGKRPKIRHRRTLIVVALGIQLPVLAIAWTVTFRNVRSELAESVQDYIVRENAEVVRKVAARLPATSGTPEFKSETWEQYQRVIETAGADLASGGFACLLDGDGKILCHPDIRRNEGLRGVDLSGKVIDDQLNEGTSLRLADADPASVYSGEIEFAADGTHYVATAVVPGTSLRLLVHQPHAALIRTSDSITRTVIGSGFVAIGTVALLSGTALVLLIRSYDGVFESLTRRLKGDLQIAREIQQATLPSRLPSIKGFQLAAWSTPAEETGGDTFDAIGIRTTETDTRITDEDPERVILMLADATGHGVGPALAATELRAMLRMGVRLQADLKGLVRHINEQLAADLPSGRFVTGWLAIVDVSTGQIESFSAGQGPILIWRNTTSSIERLDADQIPFGVADDLGDVVARAIDLRPGDAIVVPSDGLLEAPDATGDRFGIERLEDVIRGAAVSADKIAVALREAVDDFAAVADDDDKTLIVLRRDH